MAMWTFIESLKRSRASKRLQYYIRALYDEVDEYIIIPGHLRVDSSHEAMSMK